MKSSSPLASLLIKRPLGVVFWIYGVIPSQILWGMALFAYFNGASLATNLLMFGLILGYTAWIIMEIWLCADNVRNKLYGDMARLLTAAWAINSVLLVFFLVVQRLGSL
ncbi:transmembrane protein [Stutzerimonas degradans]|nr:transmembrane protein [Stutzerimonas degradans]